MSSTTIPRPAGGDQDLGPNLEVAALTTIIIAAIVVGARFYARARVVKSVGWDDWLMLLALALGIISTATEIVATDHEFGRHLYYVPPANLSIIGKYLSLSGAFCNLALMFAKLSLVTTLLRILSGTSHSKLLLYSIYIFAFTILSVNVSVTATQFAQCSPTHKLWDRTAPGHCWDPKIQRDLSYLQGAYSAFTDFVLCVLPVVLFRDLKMSRGSRNALVGVMCLGSVTGALAIARTVETWRYSGVNDSTWTSVTLLMLSALERNFAIILASVPPCRPLLRKDWSLPSLNSIRSLVGTSRSGFGSVVSLRKTSTIDEKHAVDARETV